MTSKERIRAALARKPVDRLPASMNCVQTTWENLMKHFNVDNIDAVQEILNIDTRIMDLPPFIGKRNPDYVNADGETVKHHPMGYGYVDKWNGVEFNSHVVDYPLDYIETWEDFYAYDKWVNPDDFDYDAVTAFCDKHADKAIRIGWPGPYQNITHLMSAEKFYIMMIEEPEIIQAILDRHCDSTLEIYRRMFVASGDRIDFMKVCDDYGTQTSLLFSVDMWEEFFAKNTKRYVKLCHEHNAFYMQHSCGAIRQIIPNIIACGADALEPIQKVVGMEPAGLKKDFGDKLCFQGGVDTQYILPQGTPEEVLAETLNVIKGFDAINNSGYILASSQDLEGDVSVENIIAMFSARDYI